MSGIAISVIDASSVASRIPSVQFDKRDPLVRVAAAGRRSALAPD